MVSALVVSIAVATFASLPHAAEEERPARLDAAVVKLDDPGSDLRGDPDLRDGDPASSNSNDNGTDRDLGKNGVLLAGEVHYHHNRDSNLHLFFAI
jgi:hypothetical protein